MTNLVQSQFFSYFWKQIKDEDATPIRIYGLDEKNQSVCVCVENFTPSVYIELPINMNIDWDNSQTKVQMVATKIRELLREKAPTDIQFIKRKRLYYANFDKEKGRLKFPYLYCQFNNPSDISELERRLRREIYLTGVGKVKLKVHEHNASAILQLTSKKNIPTAGWIAFKGKEVKKGNENRVSTCESEYIVDYRHLSASSLTTTAKPLVMSFDIEVNSSIPSSMPKANRNEDKIFQCSCIFQRQGEKKYEQILLTLGEVDEKILGEEISVINCETESDLLTKFTTLVREKQPNVVIGYNIFNFDLPYMHDRSGYNLCMGDFDRLGFTNDHSERKEIKWSSSAYKNQKFEFLDAEGRLFIDLLPIVKRDQKLPNYSLKTVSSIFLKGATKDPLTPKGIFKCYRLGMKGGEKGRKALAICGKYCVKDALLVIQLFEVFTTWYALCEMSKVCNLPIFQLFTQGQQLKIFSQVYKRCWKEGIVVEKDGYVTKANEFYTGATVLTPIPGIYDQVLPFDFSSLYPTSIIAHNISWDTLVTDEKIPDEMCHVMSWEDHLFCEHDPRIIRKKELVNEIKKIDDEMKILRGKRDENKKDKKHVEKYKRLLEEKKKEAKPLREEKANLTKTKPKHIICGVHKYRWLKEPMGVLPELLMHLIDTRKATKKLMGNAEKELEEMKKNNPNYEKDEKYNELSIYRDVLDNRQNALKISANSGYGALGVTRGYLPFMPGAMCTTYIGRKAIEKASKSIQNDFKGKLVYGDSVVGDTPIMIRYEDGSIDLKTIECLGRNWQEYDEFKMEDSNRKEKEQSLIDCEVWTKTGWSKIKRVIRHKTNKVIYRVTTEKGCVDVTEDHSLLDEKGEIVKPEEVEKNRKLLHLFPENFEEYETNIQDGLNQNGLNQEMREHTLCEEEAFIWGFILANGKYNSRVKEYVIDCDFEIGNKIKGWFGEEIEYDYFRDKLICKEEIAINLHQTLYDEQVKIVPYAILNSGREIKKSFISGYFNCDNINETREIRLNNKLELQGLYIVLKSLGCNIRIGSSEDSRKFTLNVNPVSIRSETIVSRLFQQRQTEYVYDIETQDGTFHAGIGELIVKNTDSNYVSFPHLKTSQECWDHAVKVAAEVTKLFPKPMSLAFEEKLFWRFFILTKKRYMYIRSTRDGVLDNKISKKGVLLTRRDNCDFIRKVYSDLVMMIFYKKSKEDIYDFVLGEMNKLCSSFYPSSQFLITKSIGDVGNLLPVEHIENKGQKDEKMVYKVGDYTIQSRDLLPMSQKEREKILKKKKIEFTTEENYYLSLLGAQVQLAERMRNRGQLVSAGSRIEYVITNMAGHGEKQSKNIESYDYFVKHSSVLKIDYLYYLKQMIIPFDQIFTIMFNDKDFALKQYKYRLQKMKMTEQLKSVFEPKIRIVGGKKR